VEGARLETGVQVMFRYSLVTGHHRVDTAEKKYLGRTRQAIAGHEGGRHPNPAKVNLAPAGRVKARNPRPEAPAFILVKRAIRD